MQATFTFRKKGEIKVKETITIEELVALFRAGIDIEKILERFEVE